MKQKIKITVNHDVCVGNAMCTAATPKVFRLNKDRQSEVFSAEGDTLEKILDAAANCPVSAITVEDTEKHKTLFP